MKASILAAAVVAVAPVVLPAQSTGLGGRSEGSAALTNSWTDAGDPRIALRCVYTGKAQPPSIRLSLPSGGDLGQLVLDIPSSDASCPPLRKRFQIRVEIAGTRLTFTDPAGDRWTLTLTEDLLTGEVTWRASGENPSEALAVGFTYGQPLRPWDVPLTRLFGKVTLRRAGGMRDPGLSSQPGPRRVVHGAGARTTTRVSSSSVRIDPKVYTMQGQVDPKQPNVLAGEKTEGALTLRWQLVRKDAPPRLR